MRFVDRYGPITAHGVILGGSAAEHVDWGEVDFLTANTLWDFKMTARPPASAHTLQLLLLWIMGTRLSRPGFDTITHLGLFNPRTNTVYRIAVSAIPVETIVGVSRDVMGYND
jgi:hypothetical protein